MNAEIRVGQQFAAWFVAAIPNDGKRVNVMCSCGQLATISAEALLSGDSQGCGACAFTPATIIMPAEGRFDGRRLRMRP